MGKIEKAFFDEKKIDKHLPVFWLLIVFVFVLGIVFASVYNDSHWVEKSGKIMVAASLLLTYLQFKYEGQLPDRMGESAKIIEEVLNDKGFLPNESVDDVIFKSMYLMKNRFEETRRKVLLCALTAAGGGEFIAAFGGDVFHVIKSL